MVSIQKECIFQVTTVDFHSDTSSHTGYRARVLLLDIDRILRISLRGNFIRVQSVDASSTTARRKLDGSQNDR